MARATWEHDRPQTVVHTLRALLLPIVLSVALSVLGLWLVRRYVSPADLHMEGDAIGSYLQTVGTIYAVLLAFIIFVVWQQFDQARGHVEREANEVTDLYRTVQGLPASVRDPVQAGLRAYVDAVLGREWAAMSCNDHTCIDEVGRVLDQIWTTLRSFAPDGDGQAAVYSEALARFNDISDVRSLRLTSARTRMPLALQFLMYTGAVITVGSMYLLEVQKFRMHAIITGALAGAIAHVVYLARDLDDCFHGDWQVPREAFLRVRRLMARTDDSKAAPPPTMAQSG